MIAMPAVAVMQMAGDEVIGVVAMRHALMPATGAVLVIPLVTANVIGGALVRIHR